MIYISVAEAAKKWGISERSVRNYCALGRVAGARLSGKTWEIPDTAEKPERAVRSDKKRTLLDILREEKASRLSGGIYHRVQIDLTYNSNHIEGSRLTHDETRYIFETNTIGLSEKAVNVDDIIETSNHFRCIDCMIDNAHLAPTEKYIKELHFLLKSGTSDSRLDWFRVGEYKRLANEVGGMDTTEPVAVEGEMRALLDSYNKKKEKSLEDILAFHVAFERIHPFQDGNGRVGRLIMFGECLRHNVTPFIIDEEHKLFYYRGLKEWDREKGYLIDTCLSAQDKFKAILKKFNIDN
nr:Fic family protein [Clostridia bacterium]